MKQISLARCGFELAPKRTRKRVFLQDIDLVIFWSDLLALIAPHAPAGKTPALCTGDDTAHSLAAAVLWPLRPRDGKSLARHLIDIQLISVKLN